MMGKSVNMVLSPPRDGRPPHLCRFYIPIKSSLHLSSGWLRSLFQAGVQSQDGVSVLCTFPWGTCGSGGSRLSRDAHRGSGTQQGADGAG